MDLSADHSRAVELVFLALVAWREARGEPHEAKLGVAFSLMNRVARPSWWGRDVLSVATKKWQYSSLTDPKDRQLTTWPGPAEDAWLECLEIAGHVLEDKVRNPVPGADSYYDISIPPPKWADPACFVGQLGRIRFFDLDKDYQEGTA